MTDFIIYSSTLIPIYIYIYIYVCVIFTTDKQYSTEINWGKNLKIAGKLN